MAKYPVKVNITKYPLKAAAPKVAAPKPMPAPKPNKAATQATLNRAARVQGEEARSEALLMKRRPAAKDTISVVTRMRETPAKKK